MVLPPSPAPLFPSATGGREGEGPFFKGGERERERETTWLGHLKGRGEGGEVRKKQGAFSGKKRSGVIVDINACTY